MGSGGASHLGNGSLSCFPCDLDLAWCCQSLGLWPGLTKSGHLGRAGDGHSCTSATGFCRVNWLELRRWCLSMSLLWGWLWTWSCEHLQPAGCSPIQPHWKKDQFASPQYGNSMKSGVISSCFPKQTSDPNSTAFRSFPCVSLVYCLLDQDLQESLRC